MAGSRLAGGDLTVRAGTSWLTLDLGGNHLALRGDDSLARLRQALYELMFSFYAPRYHSEEFSQRGKALTLRSNPLCDEPDLSLGTVCELKVDRRILIDLYHWLSLALGAEPKRYLVDRPRPAALHRTGAALDLVFNNCGTNFRHPLKAADARQLLCALADGGDPGDFRLNEGAVVDRLRLPHGVEVYLTKTDRHHMVVQLAEFLA